MNKTDYYTFNEYMKSNTLTPSEEDYIEMMYRLMNEIGTITSSDISKSLNVKMPSVTKMLKKLESKDLIIYEKYNYILLSEHGKVLGERLLNRHNIIHEFLNIIGVDDKSHVETEKIEHTITDDTLINIKRLVSFFNENTEILTKLHEYDCDNI